MGLEQDFGAKGAAAQGELNTPTISEQWRVKPDAVSSLDVSRSDLQKLDVLMRQPAANQADLSQRVWDDMRMQPAPAPPLAVPNLLRNGTLTLNEGSGQSIGLKFGKPNEPESLFDHFRSNEPKIPAPRGKSLYLQFQVKF